MLNAVNIVALNSNAKNDALSIGVQGPVSSCELQFYSLQFRFEDSVLLQRLNGPCNVHV